MARRRRENPVGRARALVEWLAALAAENPKAGEWIRTGLLSLIVGGGAAVGVSRTERGREPAIDRAWLVDSFPAHLRPTIRSVVQKENAPVFAKLDTLEEKNREVRRFIVSTAEYLRWKALRERRRREEERIDSQAERGFDPSSKIGRATPR